LLQNYKKYFFQTNMKQKNQFFQINMKQKINFSKSLIFFRVNQYVKER